MKPTSGVIFDLNGTIIDDIPYHHQVWCAILREGGVEISEEEFVRKTEKTSRAKDIMRMFFGTTPSEEAIEELVREKERRYRELFGPHLHPLPGFRTFIRDLRQNGTRTGVATSTTVDNAAFVLDGLKIRDHFDGIVTVEEVTKPKPNPEIYLKAAQKMDVKPQHCTVFEDSVAGAIAGHEAGMRVIIVKTTLRHTEIALLRGVVKVVDDFRGLTSASLGAHEPGGYLLRRF